MPSNPTHTRPRGGGDDKGSSGMSERRKPGPLKRGYLALYNGVSAVCWAAIAARVGLALAAGGAPAAASLSPGIDAFVRTVQTAAVMEIVHALTGVVPAPLSTTAAQVASRLMLVWAICRPFPQLNASAWYASMLAAWSATEVVRYSYFVARQLGGASAVPAWLLWLRYSAFAVLYPVGITSEVVLMVRAWQGPAAGFAAWYPWFIGAVLLSYVPGSVFLYGYMLKQRSKNLNPATDKALKEGVGKPREKKAQ